MKTIKIAIIGAGHLGRIHTKLLQQNPKFEVMGVVDCDPSARQQAANQFGVRVVDDTKQLTPPHSSKPLDAVVVATPTRAHYSIALPLIKRGVHVLLEKPMTLSVQEADHLNEVAGHRGVTLQVGHNERFNAAFQQARQWQPSARFIEATRTSSYTFRSIDVGVVLDLMIHDIDLVLNLVPSPLDSVQAIGAPVFGDHEDLAQARLQFENGCVANLTASRVSFEKQRWIRWYSEVGFVSADLDKQEIKSIQLPTWLKNRERDINQLPASEQAAIRDHLFEHTLPLSQVTVEPVNAIQCEHDDFYDAIQLERAPQVSGIAGAQALAVAEDILDAIATHQWQTEPTSAATPSPPAATGQQAA